MIKIRIAVVIFSTFSLLYATDSLNIAPQTTAQTDTIHETMRPSCFKTDSISSLNDAKYQLRQGFFFGGGLGTIVTLPLPYFECGYRFYRAETRLNIGYILAAGEFKGEFALRMFKKYQPYIDFGYQVSVANGGYCYGGGLDIITMMGESLTNSKMIKIITRAGCDFYEYHPGGGQPNFDKLTPIPRVGIGIRI